MGVVRTSGNVAIHGEPGGPEGSWWTAGSDGLATTREAARPMIPREAIRARDPYVLPVPEEGLYYLYGTSDEDPWHRPGRGFDAWVSTDLRRFQGPFPVFRPPPGFWGERNFWAPEVYRRAPGWVMLASFKAEGVSRAVQALWSSSPRGPFEPAPAPLTPAGWECLDGTLHEENGAPWLVFCREWLQVDDGEICALPLRPDLSAPSGPPRVLFQASEAPWVRPVQEAWHFVTDGPFLHRGGGGALWMLWSSFGRRGHAVGVARSESGGIAGPWRQSRRPLLSRGGHAMLFRTFGGALHIAFHHPNRTPDERVHWLPVEEGPRGLRVRPPSLVERVLSLVDPGGAWRKGTGAPGDGRRPGRRQPNGAQDP
jgi:arabinan endo-1,5-alpha-L-arabinosidase